MSYILDALKRSERARVGRRHTRHRSTMAEERTEPLRITINPIVVGAAVLLIFGAVLIWFGGKYWFDRGSQPELQVVSTSKPATAAKGEVTRVIDLPAPVTAPVSPPTPTPPPRVAVPIVPAPQISPAPMAGAPRDNGVGDLAQQAQAPEIEPPQPLSPASAPPVTIAKAIPPFVPARTAPSIAPDGIKFLRGMPLEFQRALPEMVVNIHVYTVNVADRMLYINNRPYSAGEKVRDDVMVEEIVQDGAVLRFRGQRFKLPRPS